MANSVSQLTELYFVICSHLEYPDIYTQIFQCMRIGFFTKILGALTI